MAARSTARRKPAGAHPPAWQDQCMTSDIAAESLGSARADGLWAERVGTRRYTGHNARGAEVRMGPVEAGDVFTPGELLKIALAGCAGMSSDHTLARHLGE